MIRWLLSFFYDPDYQADIPVPHRYAPTGICVDCDRVMELDREGACFSCGSRSVVRRVVTGWYWTSPGGDL